MALGQFLDLELPRTPRRVSRHDLAGLTSEQSLGDRRVGRQSSAGRISLARADDRPYVQVPGSGIENVHGAADRDRVAAGTRCATEPFAAALGQDLRGLLVLASLDPDDVLV